MTKTREFTTYWVCLTCMLTHANGDTGGIAHTGPKPPLHLVPEGAFTALTDERKDFSTLTCEGCGDPLDGERHALAVEDCDADTEPYEGGWRGTCTCAWRGPRYDTQRHAMSAARWHTGQ